MATLLLGPFIGDWEQEIVTFRPYARWISETQKWDNIFISGHFNRSFLYNWIPEENFIPVYEHLSRDETKQHGYINSDISQKDYNILVKEFKNHIIKSTNISRRSIEHHTVSYIKSTPPYSVYQKIFTPIPYEIKTDFSDIVIIPEKKTPLRTLKPIINKLKENYKVKIIGNIQCRLERDNEIFKKFDWPTNLYKYILSYIHTTRLVITPCSYWTYLCNLQRIPVFSWGNTASLYKNDSIYGFNNKNMIIPTDRYPSVDILMKQINSFLKIL